MKTLKRNVLRKGLFVLISLLALAPLKFKAQQCDVLMNRLHCDIKLIVEVFNFIDSGTCEPCSSSYSIVLPVGAVIPVVCCPNTCNVRVTIIAIGGVPVTPVIADYSTVPPGLPLPTGPPCAPVTGSYVHYLPGQFLFGT